jgi:ApaG protein
VADAVTEAVTESIRVRVEPRFEKERSDPRRRRYFFSYTVEIANEGADVVQLLSRRWTITDGNGRVEEVRGPGVVGQTPVLAPGHRFTYTSFCPLPTSIGSMEGTYTLRRSDGTTFEAQIPTFVLEDPDSVN